MHPTHSCSHCEQVAIECDLEGKARSGIFPWEYVTAADNSGCLFFGYCLRKLRAVKHAWYCLEVHLSVKLIFYEPDTDDDEPGNIPCLECCWGCACGVLDLDEEEVIDLMAFSVADNSSVRFLLCEIFNRATDTRYSLRKL